MSEIDPHRTPESPRSSAGARLNEEELRSFIGEGSEDYLAKWHSGSGFTSFNWAAFAFGALWFLYRKMYWTGALLLVGVGVIAEASVVALLVVRSRTGFCADS